MPIFQYETRVSPDGTIVLPPEYRNRKVVVFMDEERESPEKEYGAGRPSDDDWPNPTDEQLEKMYAMCCGVLEGMTREEFDQLREERILGAGQ